MSSSDIVQFVVLILLLLTSAFFSSSETALATANKIKLRSMAEHGNKSAALAIKVTGESDKMLSAILIGNNVANLTASSLVTTLTIKVVDFWRDYTKDLGGKKCGDNSSSFCKADLPFDDRPHTCDFFSQ